MSEDVLEEFGDRTGFERNQINILHSKVIIIKNKKTKQAVTGLGRDKWISVSSWSAWFT